MGNKSIKVNTIYNMIKTCASVIFPLITFPYVSRVLQPEGVGIYNFSNSYVSYFSLIASLGVTTYAIRECAQVKKDPQKLSEVASQIFSINVCTTIASYVLLFAILFFAEPLAHYRPVIMILSTMILFATWGAEWLNSALEDFRYITIRTIAFQLLSLMLVFLFVKGPEDYVKYAVIAAISSSGANLMNVLYRRKLCKVSFTKNMRWKYHFPGIFLLFVMQLSQTVFFNAGITMLGLMKDDTEVGLYSTATKLYTILNQVLSSILWVVMPRLSLYFAEKNYKEINSLLRKILGFMIALGLPCIVGVFMLAEEVIEIVGGVTYLAAVPALRILMVSLFFSLVGGSFVGNIILLPSKKEKYYMYVCCITAVVNVIINFLLIPKYGTVAAAISTLVSALLILFMLLPFVDKEIKLTNLKPIVLAPIIGCILIVLYVLVIKSLHLGLWMGIILSVGGSVVIYAVVLLVFRHELLMQVLQSVMNKFTKRKGD